MSIEKSPIREAAGQLVLAIQKEWNKEIGEPSANSSEDVMNTAHDFLNANSKEEIEKILELRTIKQYLGEDWVDNHSAVHPFIAELEQVINCE